MTVTLCQSQRNHFEREGYVVVRGAIDATRWLEPILVEYESVLDRLA